MNKKNKTKIDPAYKTLCGKCKNAWAPALLGIFESLCYRCMEDKLIKCMLDHPSLSGVACGELLSKYKIFGERWT